MLRNLVNSRWKYGPIGFACAIASGQFSFILPFGIFYLFCMTRPLPSLKSPIALSLLVFALLLLMDFEPPASQNYSYLTLGWLFGLVVSACFAYCFGFNCKSLSDATHSFFVIGVVLFAFGVVSVTATILWVQPPYYGQVFDIVHWGLLGSGSRVSSFLLVVPIFFTGFLVATPPLRNAFFSLVLSLTALSIILNIVLEKRIFYFMVLALLPTLFLIFNRWLNKAQATVFCATMVCLFSMAAFFFHEQLFAKFFLEYSLNGGRLWLYESFFKQLASANRFQMVLPHSLTDAPLWFHNIFMDVYRISGPWATLSLIGLFVVFALRLYALGRIKALAACSIWCWFLPLFVIANVSVVPEGEPQFLLLMVFLMGVTERMLRSTDLGHSASV
ncbi:MAG: hypothetical protein ACOYBQ_09815 [Fluviibacter sp.]